MTYFVQTSLKLSYSDILTLVCGNANFLSVCQIQEQKSEHDQGLKKDLAVWGNNKIM